jgi:hypothetical protein
MSTAAATPMQRSSCRMVGREADCRSTTWPRASRSMKGSADTVSTGSSSARAFKASLIGPASQRDTHSVSLPIAP